MLVLLAPVIEIKCATRTSLVIPVGTINHDERIKHFFIVGQRTMTFIGEIATVIAIAQSTENWSLPASNNPFQGLYYIIFKRFFPTWKRSTPRDVISTNMNWKVAGIRVAIKNPVKFTKKFCGSPPSNGFVSNLPET